jgi:hypothetical protein
MIISRTMANPQENLTNSGGIGSVARSGDLAVAINARVFTYSATYISSFFL